MAPLRPRSSSSPFWQWLTGRLQKHGPTRFTLAGTALALVLAAAAGGAIAWSTGHAPWVTAAVAGAVCALLAPWLNALVLKVWFELGRGPAGDLAAIGIDELTGVHTRLHFMSLAEREVARCRRYQTPAALLLIDADHFKRLNDQHGRACGDAVLREMTRLTQELLRQADLVGRFGGEELIVFLPHTDPLGALDVADRIRERIGGLRMPWRDGHVHVTVSVGVAALEPVHTSAEALIHDADGALFAAKEAGRNCVRAAPIQPRRNGENRRVPARK